MSEIMQYVLEKFYPYFWRKFKFPVEADTESECEEYVEKLREAVWVHRILTLWHWSPFLDMNLKPMVSSPKTYVSFIFFMISTTIKDLPNIHESFMTSCSLVTAVAAYVYDKGYYEFLEYCPAILNVLYEENYSEKSERIHVWKYLQDHLITCNYSEAYSEVEKRTQGKPFADVINTIDFVKTIRVLIKSNISVSEHAEVYLHTMKAINSFQSRTARKPSLFENRAMDLNAWSKLQVSPQNTKEKKGENVEGMSAKPIEPTGLNNSKSFLNIKKGLTGDLGSVISSDGTQYKEESKRDQLLQPDLPQNDERLRKSVTENGAETETINFGSISLHQVKTWLEEFFKLEKEKIDKKIPQSPSEKQPLQEKTPTISEKGKGVLGLDLESISSSQPGMPPTRDMQKPKKSESKQGASTNGAVDSNRMSSQSEQSVEDFKTPEKAKSEQIICAKNDVVKSPLAEHLFRDEEKQSLESNLKDTEVFDLKQFSSPPSELSLRDESKKKPEIEQSSAKVDTKAGDLPSLEKNLKDTEIIDLKQFSSPPSELSPRDESKKKPEIEQSSAKVDTEADGLPISSSHSEEPIKGSSMEESEDIDLKVNLPSQTKQPLREDFEKPRMPENEQTLSAAEETGDIHLKQIASFQSEEQPVQSDINKLGILDSEQSTPVGSSLNDLNSKNDDSRIKTEYPDTPRDTKATGQSTKSGTLKKHKRKKTKSPLQDEKTPKTSTADQSSTKVQDTAVVDLSTSSASSERSLQTMEEKSSDAETALPVPSKKDALRALLFLIQRLNDNFLTVRGLLSDL